MAPIADSISDLMEQRAVHVAEMQGHADAIAAIDAELNSVKALLGMTNAVEDAALPTAIVAHLETHGPSTLKALQEASGKSFYRVNRAIGELGPRVDLIGNTTRRFVRLAGDDRLPPSYSLPAPKPRALAPRGEDVQCIRPGCSVIFRPGGGTSGLYCSRACYDAVRQSQARQPVEPRRVVQDAPPAPLEPRLQEVVDTLDRAHAAHGVTFEDITPPQSADLAAADAVTDLTGRAAFPERRCGRCMKKFRPTREREYVCPACVDKPARVKPDADPDIVQTVFSGADSLASDAAGLGGSLAGEHRLRVPR